MTALIAHSGRWDLGILAATVFAEYALPIGFFLPGDSLLFSAGLLVAAGALGLPFPIVLAATCLAAVLGGHTGFHLGRRYGACLVARVRFLPQERVARAMALVQRRGSLALVLGRFVPVVRTVVPALAGTAGIDRRLFAVWNVVGAVLWCASFLGLGHTAGSVPFIAGHPAWLIGALEVLLLAGVGVHWWRLRHAAGLAALMP